MLRLFNVIVPAVGCVIVIFPPVVFPIEIAPVFPVVELIFVAPTIVAAPRVDKPVTPKVPLKLMLAGLNDPLVVRFPVIFTPADELVIKFIF